MWAPRTSLLSTLKVWLNCPKSNMQRGQPKFQNPSLVFLLVLQASLTLHEFWSTLGHFEKHPTSAKGNPLTNRSTGGIRIPFMKPQKPIPSKETREKQQTLSSLKEYHSSPQQQAARSQVPNLPWHSPRVCHQSTPSDWHRLSFPQKDGRFF